MQTEEQATTPTQEAGSQDIQATNPTPDPVEEKAAAREARDQAFNEKVNEFLGKPVEKKETQPGPTAKAETKPGSELQSAQKPAQQEAPAVDLSFKAAGQLHQPKTLDELKQLASFGVARDKGLQEIAEQKRVIAEENKPFVRLREITKENPEVIEVLDAMDVSKDARVALAQVVKNWKERGELHPDTIRAAQLERQNNEWKQQQEQVENAKKAEQAEALLNDHWSQTVAIAKSEFGDDVASNEALKNTLIARAMQSGKTLMDEYRDIQESILKPFASRVAPQAQQAAIQTVRETHDKAAHAAGLSGTAARVADPSKKQFDREEWGNKIAAWAGVR